MLAARAFALVLAALVPATASADGDADAWLVRMARALDALEYQGVFVYVHDGQVEAMQVSRTIGASGPRDHLAALTGDRRQVVRDGDVVQWLLPGGLVTLSNPRPAPALWRIDVRQLHAARAHYRYEVLGRGRVAGYEAAIVQASPVDALRYGYRLWIERETGMLLGSALLAPDGSVVEQLMFTSLRLRTARAPAASAQELAREPSRPRLVADWRVPGLPAGFELAAIPSAPGEARHFLYTDGLANVSVYVEPAAGAPKGMSGASRRGAINAYAHRLNGFHVFVIGDLPAATVERVARSVERAQ